MPKGAAMLAGSFPCSRALPSSSLTALPVPLGRPARPDVQGRNVASGSGAICHWTRVSLQWTQPGKLDAPEVIPRL